MSYASNPNLQRMRDGEREYHAAMVNGTALTPNAIAWKVLKDARDSEHEYAFEAYRRSQGWVR